MTLKRILCALLCALMLASIPALAEEAAEAVPAEETAVEETAVEETAEEAPLSEADKTRALPNWRPRWPICRRRWMPTTARRSSPRSTAARCRFRGGGTL